MVVTIVTLRPIGCQPAPGSNPTVELAKVRPISRAYAINEPESVPGPGWVSRGFLWQNGQMRDLGDLFRSSGLTIPT